jgi:sulfite reductase (NADPH) hemoprotein beta-component
LRIEAGRIRDTDAGPHQTGLREIAKVHRGDFRLTPNQNLTIANVDSAARTFIDSLVVRYGLDRHERATPVARDALACVALPTCGLAMAEAERYLPRLIRLVEERMTANGVGGEPLVLRITGCPNGCARPYLAEIALIGKAPGRYNLYFGGDGRGQRLNVLHLENIDEPTLISALDGAFARYSGERLQGERFGDFAWRAGLVESRAPAKVAG